MSKKTKTVFVLISLVLLLVVGNIVKAEWRCHGACTGCILYCDDPEIGSECCAYCLHTYLGKVWCCYPDLCRNAEH